MAGSNNNERKKYRRVENAATKAAKSFSDRQRKALAAATPEERRALRIRFNQQRAMATGYAIQAASRPPARRSARPSRPAAPRPARAAAPRQPRGRAILPAERATLLYKLNYARTGFSAKYPTPLPTSVGIEARPSMPVSGQISAKSITLAAGAKVLICVLPEQMRYPVRFYAAADSFNVDSVVTLNGEQALNDWESLAGADNFIPATSGYMADWRAGLHPCSGYGEDPVLGTYAGSTGIGNFLAVPAYYTGAAEGPRGQLLSGYLDITVTATNDAMGTFTVTDMVTGAFDHYNSRSISGNAELVSHFPASMRHNSVLSSTVEEYSIRAGQMDVFSGGSRTHKRLLVTPTSGYVKLGTLDKSEVTDGSAGNYSKGFYPASKSCVLANGYAIIANTGSANLQVMVSGDMLYSVAEPVGLQTNLAATVRASMTNVDHPFIHAVPDVSRAALSAPHQHQPVVHDYHSDHAVPAANAIRAAEKNTSSFIEDLFSAKGFAAAVDAVKVVGNVVEAGFDLV